MALLGASKLRQSPMWSVNFCAHTELHLDVSKMPKFFFLGRSILSLAVPGTQLGR
jgi:hypothetical protein